MQKLYSLFLSACFSTSPVAAIVVAIRLHSWPAVGFALSWLVAFRAMHHTAGIKLSLDGIRDAASALRMLSLNYRLTQHEVSDFIDQATLASVSPFALVNARVREANTPVLGAWKAYLDPSGKSVIIIADMRKHDLSAQTFFLNHELGHLTSLGLSVTYALCWSLIVLLLVYGSSMALTANFWCQASIAALFCLELFSIRFGPLPEILADSFAVSRCTARFGSQEVERLLRVVIKHFSRASASANSESLASTLEFRSRANALKAMLPLFQLDDAISRISSPLQQYLAVMGQSGILTSARILMVLIVNIDPTPPGPIAFGASLAVSVAAALIGADVQRKYDFAAELLNNQLRNIPFSRGE